MGKLIYASMFYFNYINFKKGHDLGMVQAVKRNKGKKGRQIESRNQERYPLTCLRITLLDVQMKPLTTVQYHKQTDSFQGQREK